MKIERKPTDVLRAVEIALSIIQAAKTGNNDLCPGNIVWSVVNHPCGLYVRHTGTTVTPAQRRSGMTPGNECIRCGVNTANLALDIVAARLKGMVFIGGRRR